LTVDDKKVEKPENGIGLKKTGHHEINLTIDN